MHSEVKSIISPGLHLRQRGLIAVDIFLVPLVLLLSYALQPQFAFTWESTNPTQPSPFQAVLLYPGFALLCYHVAGLHDPLGDRRVGIMLFRVAIATASALIILFMVIYFASLHQLGRSILIRTVLLSVIVIGGARILLWRWSTVSPRRVGCIMSPYDINRFRDLITKHYIPIDIVAPESLSDFRSTTELVDFFSSRHVDEVVVFSRNVNEDALLACLNFGITVIDVTVFIEREYYKIASDDTELSWFIFLDLKWHHLFYHRIKRMLDVIFSIVGILLSAPILVLACLGIFFVDRGPVFYSQIRVGLRNSTYRIWKLRTMYIDAERSGVQWAKKCDSRVTSIGRILRRTRIDELPQFWNVLIGNMSIIGPRPERPEFVEKLSYAIPLYAQRHWIKPGITGWAQINYPYGASVEDAREKLGYDLYYVKNVSFLLDFHIALRTIGAVMKGSR